MYQSQIGMRISFDRLMNVVATISKLPNHRPARLEYHHLDYHPRLLLHLSPSSSVPTSVSSAILVPYSQAHVC